MKLIYIKSALKCDSFDVGIGIKISFFRVLVTIEPGRSLLQFVTTNCLILSGLSFSQRSKPIRYLENEIKRGIFYCKLFSSNFFFSWTPQTVCPFKKTKGLQR